MLKFIEVKKQLKNSKEVADLFIEKKMKDGVIPYKGGFGVVRGRRVEKIYVGAGALEKAKKDK